MHTPSKEEEWKHTPGPVASRAGAEEAEQARRRLDEIGWGLFLIMVGAIWLLPSVPDGTLLTATGLVLLLLNAIRYRRFGQWGKLSTALGVIALAAGLAKLFAVDLPLLAICVVILGASLLLQPFLQSTRTRRKHPGPPHDEPTATHG